jgi:hypothetical protein
MFVYIDSGTNMVNINLYNLSGTLINSTPTTYSGWDDTFGVKDRFVVKFNGQGENYYYLISENNVTSVILSSYDTDWAPNDYIFWYDY